MKKYQPIACTLYDHFEHLITRKQKVILITEETTIETVLVNIYAKKGEEYVELENGDVLRLDSIIKIDNLNTGEFIQCKI